MRKWLAFILSLMLLASPAFAEDLLLSEDNWGYIGYPDGGITFAIPRTVALWELDESYTEAGYVFAGSDDDLTIQLRVFSPDVLTFDDFMAQIDQEPTADWTLTEQNGERVLRYRNTSPSVYSELYGIAITGMDGQLYKISIFTGDLEDCSPEAAVWALAETIADSLCQMDFSDWPVSEE